MAAINKVTSAKYGALTAASLKAATVTEVAVSFAKAPAAAGGAQKIDISGTMAGSAYVYCAVAKTYSARRML